MSRHRNVRQMVEEDYYDDQDDYYDDNYYDDYDYPQQAAAPAPSPAKKKTTAVAAPKKALPNKKGALTPPKQQQQQQAQHQQRQPQQATTKSATTTTTTTTRNRTPPRHPPPGFSAEPPVSAATTSSAFFKQQPKTNSQQEQALSFFGGASSGVTAPPPGFSAAPPPPGFSAAPPPGFATKKAPPTTTTASAPSTPRQPLSPVPSRSSSRPNTPQPPASKAAAPIMRDRSAYKPPPVPEWLWQTAAADASNKPPRKPTVTCVVMGHVDAGKSTLTGRLLWSTSSTTGKRQQQRPPENFAWLLDEDEQERERGITMDVATKTISNTPHYHCLVLQDAPGHADYVPHLISGTAPGVEAALCVVDVTDGPGTLQHQLREHLYLAKGLGVTQLIMAINKMELVDWQKEAFDAMRQSLSTFLFQSVGFVKSKVQFIPLSGLTSVNVMESVAASAEASWYKGPTLWHALQHFDVPSSKGAGPRKILEKPLRLLVTDILGEQSKGVAVRTKVVAGWCDSETPLTVWPLGDEATIGKWLGQVQEGLSSTNTTPAAGDDATAVAGDWVDCVLTGVDVARLSVGHVLTRRDDFTLVTSSKCRARIFVLETPSNVPIIRGATALMHLHTVQVPCHLSQLIQATTTTTGAAEGNAKAKKEPAEWKDRPRALTKQMQALVEITVHNNDTLMQAFGDCRALGRFVLRRNGESIAVGRIEQVLT